jgi:DNA-binding IscR family transcriptional regulator
VLTARTLAEQQGISHQAALGLLAQLVANGLIREATGRAAWRAFVVG